MCRRLQIPLGMNFDAEVDKVHGDSDMVVYYNDMFDVSFGFIYENRARIKTLVTKADESILFNQVHAIIKNNIMKKVGRLPATTEVTLEILAEFFAGGLIQVIEWWVTTDCVVPAEKIKDELYSLVKDILAKFNA